MKVTKKHEYIQDVDTVYASYIDHDFVKAKALALGSRNVEVHIVEDLDSVLVYIDREMPAEVPSFLKKFVNPWNKIKQVEEWKAHSNGAYTCTIKIETESPLLSINSQIQLSPAENGCTTENTTEIKSSIPFIGKKLAKFIGDASVLTMDQEHAYIGERV